MAKAKSGSNRAKKENYIHAGVSYKGEEKEYIPGFHGTAEDKARRDAILKKYGIKLEK